MKMRPLALCLVMLAFVVVPARAEITVATLNVEFLVRSKVHIKFGFPFDLTPADKVTWDALGFREQKFKEAAGAVAAAIEVPRGAESLE